MSFKKLLWVLAVSLFHTMSTLTRSVIARGRFNLDVYFYLKKSKEAGFDAVDFWQYKDYGIFHTMDPELAIDDLIKIKRQKSNINT